MAGIADDSLRERLDELDVEPIVEYLFARLGLNRGSHWLRFRATEGNLRETEHERGPITNPELEALGRGT